MRCTGRCRSSKRRVNAAIQPILGAELTLSGGCHLTLLVQERAGWANLCALITAARHNAPKGTALLPPGVLEQHTEGLIALSGCRKGEITAALRSGKPEAALAAAHRYVDWFGRDNFYIELQRHFLPNDDLRTTQLATLAGQVGVGVVATNNVHYVCREQHQLQDVLVCIDHEYHAARGGRAAAPQLRVFPEIGCGNGGPVQRLS